MKQAPDTEDKVSVNLLNERKDYINPQQVPDY